MRPCPVASMIARRLTQASRAHLNTRNLPGNKHTAPAAPPLVPLRPTAIQVFAGIKKSGAAAVQAPFLTLLRPTRSAQAHFLTWVGGWHLARDRGRHRRRPDQVRGHAQGREVRLLEWRVSRYSMRVSGSEGRGVEAERGARRAARCVCGGEWAAGCAVGGVWGGAASRHAPLLSVRRGGAGALLIFFSEFCLRTS